MADEDKSKKADAAKPEDAKPVPAPAPAPEPAKPADPVKPAPAPAPSLSIADAQLIAQVAAQVAAQMQAVQGKPATRIAGSDEAPKGGKYVIDGHTVNAWGRPFEEGRDPSLDDPEKPKV